MRRLPGNQCTAATFLVRGLIVSTGFPGVDRGGVGLETGVATTQNLSDALSSHVCTTPGCVLSVTVPSEGMGHASGFTIVESSVTA